MKDLFDKIIENKGPLGKYASIAEGYFAFPKLEGPIGNRMIFNGKEVITLLESESTYIPKGQSHRLSNPGPDFLEIIEVQSGKYLEEDDIIRMEDNYGRN